MNSKEKKLVVVVGCSLVKGEQWLYSPVTWHTFFRFFVQICRSFDRSSIMRKHSWRFLKFLYMFLSASYVKYISIFLCLLNNGLLSVMTMKCFKWWTEEFLLVSFIWVKDSCFICFSFTNSFSYDCGAIFCIYTMNSKEKRVVVGCSLVKGEQWLYNPVIWHNL